MSRALLLIAALGLEAEEEERRAQLQNSMVLRRHLRNRADALVLSDVEFRYHYRLSKELFHTLCAELAPHLPTGHRNSSVTVQCKVLTALSFFATGSYQKPVGMSFLHALSQPSVSKAVRQVTKALNNMVILTKYIKFPRTRQERQHIVSGFYNKFQFPGVLGCVDGTHVALVRPSEHEERFFNRKHYHSRNVQIVCDSDLYILNVDATFGGASHDAHIWRSCELNAHMQELHHSGENVWLLGDSGYPLRPWLMTPITNTTADTPEANYTDMHCQVRNAVERCIGVLKARWRCLLAHRVLHYKPDMVAQIINGCCVLHNIAVRNGLEVPHLPQEDLQSNNQREVHTNSEDHQLAEARSIQTNLVNRLWRN